MDIGTELKKHREANNLTQNELAKKTGLTQAAISRWESNKRIPDIISCRILADTYEITIDELIDHKTKKNW